MHGMLISFNIVSLILNAFGSGVVDLIHVVMLGGVCEFLYSIGHYNFSLQMCDKIRLICKILTPEFDFISLIESFVWY